MGLAGEPWFGPVVARAQARAVLFCLPYAGGGTSAFAAWRRAFPVAVAVEPVRLPGREQRIGEPPRVDPAEVADAVLARAGDRHWAIYGHSMGGWLAFEVVRELRRRAAPLPARLYVGGSRPPDVPDPGAAVVELPDEQFLDRVVGPPDAAPGLGELRALLLPMLRADFGWLYGYACLDEPPLPVPVVGFAGAEDPVVEPSLMAGWARHTTGGFRLHVLPGDHYFLQGAADRLAALLSADLLAAAPSTPDGAAQAGSKR